MKYTSHSLILFAIVFSVGISYLIASRTKSERGDLTDWLLVEKRRAQALEQRAKEIYQARQVKKSIMSDLIAKRLTLREAVEGFRQADELIEDYPNGLIPAVRRAKTERELYRQIRVWTQMQLDKDPRQAEEVLQRLEKEWAQSFVEDEE